MTSRSRRPGARRGAVGVSLLVATLFGLTPAPLVWADETASPSAAASPSPTASPEPNPTTTVGATADSLEGLSAPVRDIITTVESIDGSETQKNSRTKRTVILQSKVLFPEDRATLSAAARRRLREVAGQIVDASAKGKVRVDGYTDDQGSAQHGLVLSRQRAKAVRGVLAPLLTSAQVQIVIRGLGEANPRFPNNDKAGRPIPANQAKNRRVEISFTPGG